MKIIYVFIQHQIDHIYKLQIQLNKDWCVAQTGVPTDKLQAFLDYACGVNDCSAIQSGASCFEPNDVISHASYALNQEYRRPNVCHIDIATISTIDPCNLFFPLLLY
ncbi:glucan endo-1,3-beta-glucosidase 12 [Dorcoceras hygrometricum]|uniref:Glucan endo-1,3-beta-glucosidase 12 n=1 Tax=Dorcoceras hygrometricum TaxID=472368 RepID=A0A2Z7BAE1_9LAMI|nr:glucan endo-1,3-beta-glucosidase 12 [Dorcoceras hygrometricum]